MKKLISLFLALVFLLQSINLPAQAISELEQQQLWEQAKIGICGGLIDPPPGLNVNYLGCPNLPGASNNEGSSNSEVSEGSSYANFGDVQKTYNPNSQLQGESSQLAIIETFNRSPVLNFAKRPVATDEIGTLNPGESKKFISKNRRDQVLKFKAIEGQLNSFTVNAYTSGAANLYANTIYFIVAVYPNNPEMNFNQSQHIKPWTNANMAFNSENEAQSIFLYQPKSGNPIEIDITGLSGEMSLGVYAYADSGGEVNIAVQNTTENSREESIPIKPLNMMLSSVGLNQDSSKLVQFLIHPQDTKGVLNIDFGDGNTDSQYASGQTSLYFNHSYPENIEYPAQANIMEANKILAISKTIIVPVTEPLVAPDFDVPIPDIDQTEFDDKDFPDIVYDEDPSQIPGESNECTEIARNFIDKELEAALEISDVKIQIRTLAEKIFKSHINSEELKTAKNGLLAALKELPKIKALLKKSKTNISSYIGKNCPESKKIKSVESSEIELLDLIDDLIKLIESMLQFIEEASDDDDSLNFNGTKFKELKANFDKLQELIKKLDLENEANLKAKTEATGLPRREEKEVPCEEIAKSIIKEEVLAKNNLDQILSSNNEFHKTIKSFFEKELTKESAEEFIQAYLKAVDIAIFAIQFKIESSQVLITDYLGKACPESKALITVKDSEQTLIDNYPEIEKIHEKIGFLIRYKLNQLKDGEISAGEKARRSKIKADLKKLLDELFEKLEAVNKENNKNLEIKYESIGEKEAIPEEEPANEPEATRECKEIAKEFIKDEVEINVEIDKLIKAESELRKRIKALLDGDDISGKELGDFTLFYTNNVQFLALKLKKLTTASKVSLTSYIGKDCPNSKTATEIKTSEEKLEKETEDLDELIIDINSDLNKGMRRGSIKAGTGKYRSLEEDLEELIKELEKIRNENNANLIKKAEATGLPSGASPSPASQSQEESKDQEQLDFIPDLPEEPNPDTPLPDDPANPPAPPPAPPPPPDPPINEVPDVPDEPEIPPAPSSPAAPVIDLPEEPTEIPAEPEPPPEIESLPEDEGPEPFIAEPNECPDIAHSLVFESMIHDQMIEWHEGDNSALRDKLKEMIENVKKDNFKHSEIKTFLEELSLKLADVVFNLEQSRVALKESLKNECGKEHKKEVISIFKQDKKLIKDIRKLRSLINSLNRKLTKAIGSGFARSLSAKTILATLEKILPSLDPVFITNDANVKIKEEITGIQPPEAPPLAEEPEISPEEGEGEGGTTVDFDPDDFEEPSTEPETFELPEAPEEPEAPDPSEIIPPPVNVPGETTAIEERTACKEKLNSALESELAAKEIIDIMLTHGDGDESASEYIEKIFKDLEEESLISNRTEIPRGDRGRLAELLSIYMANLQITSDHLEESEIHLRETLQSKCMKTKWVNKSIKKVFKAEKQIITDIFRDIEVKLKKELAKLQGNGKYTVGNLRQLQKRLENMQAEYSGRNNKLINLKEEAMNGEFGVEEINTSPKDDNSSANSSSVQLH